MPAHRKSEYLEAFKLYSGLSESQIKFESSDYGLIVQRGDQTLMISHFNDFEAKYKDIFKEKMYDELYDSCPIELWNVLLTEELDYVTELEIIVALYREWCIYWMHEQDSIPDETHYEKLRSRSWESLMILIETIKLDHTQTVKSAADIDESEMIPIVAMTIKRLYNDDEKFYDNCINNLLAHGETLVAFENTFECIEVTKKGSGEYFYIYDVMFGLEQNVQQNS